MIKTVNRSAFRIMLDTVHALLMRELKTRFGSSRLGYFWALAEPLAQAAILGLIFTLLGRRSVADVPVAIFLFSGILPYKLFSKLLPQLAMGVSANKALFSYRQVTPIDPIITRLLIEIAAYCIVYLLIISGLSWLGICAVPDRLLFFLLANFVLIIMCFGLGLSLCVAVEYWEDTPKLLTMVLSPMFYISGVFFCATMIPDKYHYVFSWNPVFHLIELGRDAFFISYVTPVGSWLYVTGWALGSLTLGLALYRVNRIRLVA